MSQFPLNDYYEKKLEIKQKYKRTKVLSKYTGKSLDYLTYLRFGGEDPFFKCPECGCTRCYNFPFNKSLGKTKGKKKDKYNYFKFAMEF